MNPRNTQASILRFKDRITLLSSQQETTAWDELCQEAERMLRLADSLEDLDDVQNFYANFDISEEDLESYV